MFIVYKLSIRKMVTENVRQIKKKTFCARKNEQTFKSLKHRYASTFLIQGRLSFFVYLLNASFKW